MSETLDNIDAAIAYLESPEYIRMLAQAQGEGETSICNVTGETPTPVVPAHSPFTDTYTVPTRYGFNVTRPRVVSRRGPNAAARRAAMTGQLMVRDGWWKFQPFLESRTPFKTYGKFYGTDEPDRYTGRLDNTDAAVYLTDFPYIDYVVYSYVTPIAWHVWYPGTTGVTQSESYWVMPGRKYSPTTTGHQGKIRVALHESGEEVRT